MDARPRSRREGGESPIEAIFIEGEMTVRKAARIRYPISATDIQVLEAALTQAEDEIKHLQHLIREALATGCYIKMDPELYAEMRKAAGQEVKEELRNGTEEKA